MNMHACDCYWVAAIYRNQGEKRQHPRSHQASHASQLVRYKRRIDGTAVHHTMTKEVESPNQKRIRNCPHQLFIHT